MIYNVYETLDLVAQAPNAEVRKQILRKHDSHLLRTILGLTFNPYIKFFTETYPAGYKPDTQSPIGMSQGNLNVMVKKFNYFINNHPSSVLIAYKTKENMLLSVLESIESREAEVVIHMMQKDLKVPGLTRAVVNEAFPGLLVEV